VLIMGETGVGKELVARALHAASQRRAEPFVAINCGALPEPLVEAELFGHARGAYTGAHAERLGLVEHARRGTVFLDEVEDLPLSVQGKLLRLIQEGTYRPLGTVRERSADVRLVAASNRDLESMVAEGRFRRDLYYRLDVLQIRVPPLRERLSDLPSLIAHLMIRRADAEKSPLASCELERAGPLPAELEVMRCHAWPGNVRELENVVERVRATAAVAGWRVGWAAVLAGLESREMAVSLQSTERDAGGTDQERLVLEKALLRHRWRRAEAARELGVSRVTLWRRMRRVGLAGDP
jgi:transcriptional regulator with PAS, ATPase and Fis domain